MKQSTRTHLSHPSRKAREMSMQWMWTRRRTRSHLQSAEGKLPPHLLSTAQLCRGFLSRQQRRIRPRKHLSHWQTSTPAHLPHQDIETRLPARSQSHQGTGSSSLDDRRRLAHHTLPALLDIPLLPSTTKRVKPLQEDLRQQHSTDAIMSGKSLRASSQHAPRARSRDASTSQARQAPARALSSTKSANLNHQTDLSRPATSTV